MYYPALWHVLPPFRMLKNISQITSWQNAQRRPQNDVTKVRWVAHGCFFFFSLLQSECVHVQMLVFTQCQLWLSQKDRDIFVNKLRFRMMQRNDPYSLKNHVTWKEQCLVNIVSFKLLIVKCVGVDFQSRVTTSLKLLNINKSGPQDTQGLSTVLNR